jgi:hypothetical protein
LSGVEQFADETIEPLAIAQRHRGHSAALVGVEVARRREEFQRCPQARQGSAEFVTDGGQELVLLTRHASALGQIGRGDEHRTRHVAHLGVGQTRGVDPERTSGGLELARDPRPPDGGRLHQCGEGQARGFLDRTQARTPFRETEQISGSGAADPHLTIGPDDERRNR